MFLNRIDQMSPEEIAAGVYQVLYAGTADRLTQQKLRDRRLIPALNAIIERRGRPDFAPPGDLPKDRTDQAMISAAYLLADIAGPQDQESVQALLGMLDYDNDRARLAASSALGALGVEQAAPQIAAFAERMAAQGEIGTVARLSEALARIGGPEAREVLARFAEQNRQAPDEQVQHTVAMVEDAIHSIDERLA